MENAPDLDRVRRLAAELAAIEPGPGSALATEFAEALAGLAARVDAVWQLISAVVASAGLAALAQAGTVEPGTLEPGTGESARTDFASAVASARRTGQHGLRLCVDGREWVAALSHETPDEQRRGREQADRDQAAWSAIQRLTRESAAHESAAHESAAHESAAPESGAHDDR